MRDGYICFTCGKPCSGRNASAGHFIPKLVGGIELWFHPDNVHCQCSYCNHSLQGNQYWYGVKLGISKVRELFALLGKKVSSANWSREKYEKKTTLYMTKVINMKNLDINKSKE